MLIEMQRLSGKALISSLLVESLMLRLQSVLRRKYMIVMLYCWPC